MNCETSSKTYPRMREETLSIEVTTHCNSPCAHCFVRARTSKSSSLPFDLVKEIILEGYHAGYRHLHITGGEPLLWEGLFEILDQTVDLGYKTVFLNTNGTLLLEDTNNILAAYDGLSISVSLEGNENLHDRIRGQGSYRQTILSIKKALHAGIKVILFTTACKSLLPDLPYFTQEIYKKFPGIKYLTLIQLIRVKDDLFDLSQEFLGPGDYLKLVQTVSLLNLYGLKTYVLNDPLAGVTSKLLNMPWIPQARPLYSYGSMIVMANRDICLSHSTCDSFGKYEPGMIAEVLASNEYRNAVAPDKATCPSCKYADLCLKTEMFRPSEWYMDMQAEVPYCKRVLDSANYNSVAHHA